MLYLNFYLYQTNATGASAGNGTYQYAFPSLTGLGFVIDNTQLIALSTGGTTPYGGTRLGSCALSVYAAFTNTGGVYYSNLNGQGLVLWSQVGAAGLGLQGSGLYQFGGTYLIFTFEAMIPIV